MRYLGCTIENSIFSVQAVEMLFILYYCCLFIKLWLEGMGVLAGLLINAWSACLNKSRICGLSFEGMVRMHNFINHNNTSIQKNFKILKESRDQ